MGLSELGAACILSGLPARNYVLHTYICVGGFESPILEEVKESEGMKNKGGCVHC